MKIFENFCKNLTILGGIKKSKKKKKKIANPKNMQKNAKNVNFWAPKTPFMDLGGTKNRLFFNFQKSQKFTKRKFQNFEFLKNLKIKKKSKIYAIFYKKSTFFKILKISKIYQEKNEIFKIFKNFKN